MTNKEIAKIAVEAAKLIKDNPKLSYREAIEKAREMIVGVETEKMEKAN